jgi:hypothetical protein
VNLMDESTYRWVQTVWGPLLATAATALVTAVVVGVVAIMATRLEAGRAEKRANTEGVKRIRRQAVLHAYESVMDTLYDSANGLQEPGQNPLTWRRLDADQQILGDPTAVAAAYELMNGFAGRPAHSGLTPKDLNHLVDVHMPLRIAYALQLELIEAGSEPVRFDEAAYRAATEKVSGKFG